MIRFSAVLTGAAIVAVAAGAIAGDLTVIYVSIGVSALAAVLLAVGVTLRRAEIFGQSATQRAGAGPAGTGPGAALPAGAGLPPVGARQQWSVPAPERGGGTRPVQPARGPGAPAAGAGDVRDKVSGSRPAARPARQPPFAPPPFAPEPFAPEPPGPAVASPPAASSVPPGGPPHGRAPAHPAPARPPSFSRTARAQQPGARAEEPPAWARPLAGRAAPAQRPVAPEAPASRSEMPASRSEMPASRSETPATAEKPAAPAEKPVTAAQERVTSAEKPGTRAEKPVSPEEASVPPEKPVGPQPDPEAGPTVLVVPGITRFHRSGCILIRFLSGDDLKAMTREQAEAAGCTPCRACQPGD